MNATEAASSSSWLVASFVAGFLTCAALWLFLHRLIVRRDKVRRSEFVELARTTDALRKQVEAYERGLGPPPAPATVVAAAPGPAKPVENWRRDWLGVDD